MRISKLDCVIITGYFCCCILVIILSWVCNMYGGSVQNLLGAEGIRRTVKYVMADFSAASPAALLYITATYGLMMKSGIVGLLRRNRRLSLKQRSAVGVTLFTGILYLVIVLLGLFLPHAILLGVTGHIERSVFSDGWLYIVTSFFLLIGIVYGTASGTFYKLSDIIEGFCSGIALFAPCFVALFLGSQLLSYIVYSSLLYPFSGSEYFIYIRILVLYLPFLLKGLHL